MNMASMRSFAAFALAAAFFGNTLDAQEDEKKPVPLDAEQKAIVEQTMDKIIASIAALKEKYPELAHFGEKPWFTRSEGTFRYDYKNKLEGSGDSTKAMPLPGGCGIYFSLKARGTPRSRESYYYNWKSVGGDRAGIEHYLGITTDDPNKTLDDAVYNAVEKELEGPFEKLTSEYILRKNSTKMDTASVIDALCSDDRNIYASAMQLLHTRKLNEQELTQFREGLAQGKYPVKWGFHIALFIERDQDAAHYPDFCLAMAKTLLKQEKEGKDSFMPTPLVSGPRSEIRMAREAIVRMLDNDGKEPDARLAPAALELLANDPVLQNRMLVMDYFAKLPAKERREGIVAGFGNSFFSVQAKAAEMAAKFNEQGLEKEWMPLLASPSSKVRKAAKNEAAQAGYKDFDLDPSRTLPDSATRISDVLWKSGLRDEDVVRVCADVERRVFKPMAEPPAQAELPKGVTIESQTQVNEKGKVTGTIDGNYYVVLNDLWRMTVVDADSVKKRAAQYVVGIRKNWGSSILDPTGPFLLAAAMKFNDRETAQRIYERMCDEYENEDAMTYIGIEGLGWEFTTKGLDAFERGKDGDAEKLFATVIALENQAKPFTFLGQWVKLTQEVTADIERRKTGGVAPAEMFLDENEEAAFWRKKIPDATERIKTLVEQLENSGQYRKGEQEGNYFYRARPGAALAHEGIPAVEPLVECVLHDDRLTRTVESNMDHGEQPVRWVKKVRIEAVQALGKILGRNFFTSPENYNAIVKGDPAALQKIADEVRKAAAAQKK